jgi:chromosomal replication initiator protein
MHESPPASSFAPEWKAEPARAPRETEPLSTDGAPTGPTAGRIAGGDGAGDEHGPSTDGPVRLGETWSALQRAIQERVQPEQFETWFRRAALRSVDSEAVELAVQNEFSRNWLESHYRGVIEDAVRATFGTRELRIEIDAELTVVQGARPPREAPTGVGSATGPRPANGSAGATPARPAGTNGSSSSREARGLLTSSDFALNAKYTFDSFVVGPCNRFAHAAAVGVAESPGKAYNPFFLHGSVGLGKTHLLQSVCFALLERDHRTRILYLSCETFVNHYISALENGDFDGFRDKYRNVDVLVVDDIHILANKERTQEEFFHTFNALYNNGKQIVLSSDSPPKDIPSLQERLVSRFKWGLVTEIEPPCYETRMAILKRKSRERGRELPDSNIRELEGAVTKIIGYASLSSRPITIELVREVLSELFELRRGQPAMEDILSVVTEHFSVKLTELQSRKRTNAIAYPRQVAMFLARRLTRHSLEEIGGYFGGRDHSTVLYAVTKIQRESQRDEACRAHVADLLDRLQSAPSGPS